jgi:glycosyltransferase involved in cell wall biosynthesis
MGSIHIHFLIPVFFHAPLGGLQAHVFAQAMAIQNYGWKATVLCKPGPFAEHCRANRIDVIESDFSDIKSTAQGICRNYKFDVVHAHPFISRKLGEEIAGEMNIPIVLTIHGQYTDGLERGNKRIQRIYCVGHAIRDNLVKQGIDDLHRVFVLPNAVDLNVFHPIGSERIVRWPPKIGPAVKR